MLTGNTTKKILGIAALWLCASLAHAQTDVLVSHNDGGRTGQNLSETVLNTQNVNVGTFGKVYSYPLDGATYAQPLLKSRLAIPGKGTYNVLFLATEHGSVYALDADTATPIWRRSFINPATGLTPRSANSSLEDLVPEVSITSTPVIDSVGGTLYVLAETVQSGQPAYYWLHALDFTTGADKVAAVRIQASVGSGAAPLSIDAATSEQRPGLVFSNGVVYVAFGSNGDNFPWVGWLVGYDGTSLAQVSVFCTSPGGNWGSGVWSSGEAPPVDASGNIYIATGNGYFSAGVSYGDSWVKLGTSGGLTALDYFSPFNQAALGSADLDLASAGLILLPDGAGSSAHPHLIVGTGKDGELYLVDRDNMGHFNGSYSTPNSNIVQYIPSQIGTGIINPTNPSLPYTENSYTTPAYWQGHVYFCGVKDACKAFTLTNGLLSTTPTAQSPTAYGYPGGQPVISAASTSATSAILWALERNSANNVGVLHAYDATNLGTELYNSAQAANQRDAGGAPVKFAVPTIANGKVFVGSQGSVDVYGLLSGAPKALAAPTFSPTPSSYSGTQSVTIAAPAGATIYYTLDGSLPTLSSAVYTGPLSIAATTTVNAMAVQSGSLTSPVASGTYTITATAQIRYIQGNYATPQSPQGAVTVKYLSAQQQGDLNVVVVGWNDSSATVKSVGDSSGNTYALAAGPTVLSGVASQAIYYASNIASAAGGANTVTVSFSTPAVYPDIRVAEYAGIAAGAALDATAAASGSSAAAASGAANTTFANDLIVGADLTVQYTAVGSGFTSRLLTVPDGDILEDRIVTAAGSYSATATISPAGAWIMQLAAFKGAGGGGGTPTPTAPSALTASAAGTSSITLSWTAATESGGAIASYLIERCQGSGCSSFAQVGTTTTTSFSDSGLSAATSYSYRVRAKDGAGNTGPYSNTASAQTAAAAPSAPSSLTASAAGSTQVTLSWGAASETGGTIASYLVERCQGTGCSSFAQVGTTTTLTFTDAGLSGSTSYSYRVRAKDSAGNTGPYSNTASAVTAAPTITAPTSLAAVSASAGQINLTWSAASESGGTISQYLIERCQGAGCSTFAQIATSPGAAYNDVGLSAATSYSYRVRARDGAGNTGPYSNVASATTGAGTTPPAIAFVQVGYATPQTPQSKVTVPLAAAQGAGDLNVVVIGWNDATAMVGSVTDAKGNTYQLAAGPTVISGTASQAIYYAANVAAGSNSVTISFTSAAAYPDVRVAEYSGIATSNALDVTATGSGNGTLSASAAVSTTNANDLIVGANLVLTTTTAAGAGFTNRVITNPDSDILEDRVVTATGSYSATAPLIPGSPWIMQLAAFRRHP
ncbi:MAG TPA: fibronectin type III domain-containing protein [Steroidobacteraceae bacterium]|nr:fibronectin type III domain-containing protein [Steroidobacteraceae bacterium]